MKSSQALLAADSWVLLRAIMKEESAARKHQLKLIGISDCMSKVQDGRN